MSLTATAIPFCAARQRLLLELRAVTRPDLLHYHLLLDVIDLTSDNDSESLFRTSG